MSGMITYGRPSVASRERYLASQIGCDYSYPNMGCTYNAAPAPRGFRHDQVKGLIGRGQDTFDLAVAAMREWLIFDQPGALSYPPRAPLVPGTHLLVAGVFGPWWFTGAGRIVEVFDEPWRFGVAYGTIDHVVRGEELYLLTIREDGSVWLSVNSYNRPDNLWVTAASPMVQTVLRRVRSQAIARIAIAAHEPAATS